MKLSVGTRGWVVLGLLGGAGVLGAVACVGDSTTQIPPDAGPDVTPTVDASSDAAVDAGLDAGPACDKTKPFGTPEVLLGTPNVAEDGFWLSSDLRTAYASMWGVDGGAGFYDLFTFSRNTTVDPWGSLTPLSVLNTAGMDRGPVVTDNGLEIFFFRNTTSNGYDIFVSTRATTSVAFGPPASSTLNTALDEVATWVSPDGLAVYIQSNRTGTLGSDDLWRAERGDVKSQFGTPVSVSGIDSTSTEGSGVLTSDELEIFFTSNRPGGKGGVDIYRATRSTKNDGFGTPSLVPELNSALLDFPVWLSPDGCTIHFGTSEKADGASATSYDVYRATRPK